MGLVKKGSLRGRNLTGIYMCNVFFEFVYV